VRQARVSGRRNAQEVEMPVVALTVAALPVVALLLVLVTRLEAGLLGDHRQDR
jgi:hypothetical protein